MRNKEEFIDTLFIWFDKFAVYCPIFFQSPIEYFAIIDIIQDKYEKLANKKKINIEDRSISHDAIFCEFVLGKAYFFCDYDIAKKKSIKYFIDALKEYNEASKPVTDGQD